MLHCSDLNALPALPLQPVSTAAMVQELVVEESNIPEMWTRELCNKYHMTSLRRMDLTECMVQAIQDNSFYQMSLLQNLNLRYVAFLLYL